MASRDKNIASSQKKKRTSAKNKAKEPPKRKLTLAEKQEIKL